MGNEGLTRREVIAGSLLLGLTGLGIPVSGQIVDRAPARPDRKRVFRFAHLTDSHVQPDGDCPERFARCVEHVLGQKDRPQLILTGGDLIMHATEDDPARVRAQWDVFHRVIGGDLGIPVRHTIGNHDVWGWPDRDNDPRRGKRWAMDELGLEKPYYTFDEGNWTFVVLDSTAQRGTGYVAQLDDEQFEWLGGVLAAVPEDRHVIVASHEPILCACAFFDGENEKSGDWRIPGQWVHIDARRIKDLFARHPQVRLAISGHMHLVDRVDYLGVTYLCNGAVSGAWWKGSYQEFGPGYALIDLYDDGTFDREFVFWEKSA